MHGNGYDLCGPLEYSLTGTNKYTDQYLVFKSVSVADNADVLKFIAQSYSTGKIIMYDMFLTAKLVNFPTSTPAVIPVTFNYRECYPFNFEFKLDTDLVEIYAEETSPDLDVSVNQAPCTFDQSYIGYLGGAAPLPKFMILTQDGVLMFRNVKASDVGEYNITLRTEINT